LSKDNIYHRNYAADFTPLHKTITKIKRETTNFIKSDKKCKELSKKLLNEYSDCQDELLDQYEEFKLISVKEMKNAKGHKNRLKELSKNKDFI